MLLNFLAVRKIFNYLVLSYQKESLVKDANGLWVTLLLKNCDFTTQFTGQKCIQYWESKARTIQFIPAQRQYIKGAIVI